MFQTLLDTLTGEGDSVQPINISPALMKVTSLIIVKSLRYTVGIRNIITV